MKDTIRVLYIEDYALDRELVRDALEREHGGFHITEASNRTEFLEALDTNQFDAVLSDFNIAGFEGLQVIEIIKEHNPTIPVVIVTGTGSEEIAVQAIQNG
ncbi:MAG: response regulator, partial [Desulfamplus sp.]|nr:response regulator [Desulfamplus sp.]